MTNKNQLILGSAFPTLFTSDLFKKMDDFFRDLETFNVDDLRLTLNGHPKGDAFVNKEGNLVMNFALAGYSKEQLSVSVDDNKITVSADKVDDGDEDNSFIAKRSFKKTFTDFARAWDLSSANVSYRDGLLKIVINPQTRKAAEVKNIDIK